MRNEEGVDRLRSSLVRGVLLSVAASCLAFACQDGYPIAATRCDDWCEASLILGCTVDDPAACVVACEDQGISAPACEARFEVVMSCLRSPSRNDLDCAPCFVEEQSLASCGYAAKHGLLGSE